MFVVRTVLDSGREVGPLFCHTEGIARSIAESDFRRGARMVEVIFEGEQWTDRVMLIRRDSALVGR